MDRFRRRGVILGLLVCATALSYLDRQSFPVAVVEIQKHIPLSDERYSELQTLFLLAYAAMYAGGGRLVDWIGTRLGYFLMVLVWSAATILHGLVNAVSGLAAARFLLGFGEGGGFPCSAKAVSEWFSPEQRATAFGIFNIGSSLGAVVAPPLIAIIIITLGWRWVFFLSGGCGLVWGAAWWLLYRDPGSQPAARQPSPHSARQSSLSFSTSDPPVSLQPISWASLFRMRQIWALILIKLLTDPAWFFLIFWLPRYLSDVRHLNIQEVGIYGWIPYALAGLGSFTGGWLSGFMLRHNIGLDTSRKLCLGISAVLMQACFFIMKCPLGLAVALLGIAFFAHQSWSTIVQTLPADIFPSSVVGSVSGLMGAFGSLGAGLFSLLIGHILTSIHSYSPVFIMTGLLYPISLVVIYFLLPKIENIDSVPIPDSRGSI